jgi:hypothetical protein
MNNEYLYKVALEEYFWVENQIDRFDERSLKMKSWSITVSGLTFGGAIVYEKPLLFLLASFAALIFWYLEATWKYFQDALANRIEFLEAYLNGKNVVYTGPGINRAFQDHFRWKVELKIFPRIFTLRNVNLPHSIAFGGGIALYVLNANGIIG